MPDPVTPLSNLPRWLRERFKAIANFADRHDVRNVLHPCLCKNCQSRGGLPEDDYQRPGAPCLCDRRKQNRCVNCVREAAMACALEILRGKHVDVSERIEDACC